MKSSGDQCSPGMTAVVSAPKTARCVTAERALTGGFVLGRDRGTILPTPICHPAFSISIFNFFPLEINVCS